MSQFSKRSKYTLKYDKRKKLACGAEVIVSLMIYHWKDPEQHGTYLFFMVTEQNLVEGNVIYTSFL